MKAGTFTLTPQAIEVAVMARLNRNKGKLGDREANIGASKVGYCARATVLDHLMPEEPDLKLGGKWLVGRALESEVVAVVRLAMENRVRETGRAQEELKHPTAPLICHPDGRIIGPFEGADGTVYEGDGALEIKTASAGAFKKYQEKGLPLWYMDQVTSEMGLQGTTWGLLVMVNAESIGEFIWWVLDFDPIRFAELGERASFIQGLRESREVPAGEPTRGWCKYCRHRKTCKEYIGVVELQREGEKIPETTRLELEALGEEYAEFKPELDRLKAREEEIKKEARSLAESTGLSYLGLEAVEIKFTGGGSGTELDKKAFEKAEPELYAKYLKPKITKSSFYFTPKDAPLA